jgi:hypothetical protein
MLPVFAFICRMIRRMLLFKCKENASVHRHISAMKKKKQSNRLTTISVLFNLDRYRAVRDTGKHRSIISCTFDIYHRKSSRTIKHDWSCVMLHFDRYRTWIMSRETRAHTHTHKIDRYKQDKDMSFDSIIAVCPIKNYDWQWFVRYECNDKLMIFSRWSIQWWNVVSIVQKSVNISFLHWWIADEHKAIWW